MKRPYNADVRGLTDTEMESVAGGASLVETGIYVGIAAGVLSIIKDLNSAGTFNALPTPDQLKQQLKKGRPA